MELVKDEFEELKTSATYLNYYWHLYKTRPSEQLADFEHAFFIRDFIAHNRFEEATAVTYSQKFNTVILPKEQYDYLKECVAITEQLKELVTS